MNTVTRHPTTLANKKERSVPVVTFVKKEKKLLLHATELCCAELQDLVGDKVIDFVSNTMKGHEHLAQIDYKYSAILWFTKPDKEKDYLYFQYCPFCGQEIKFRETKA